MLEGEATDEVVFLEFDDPQLLYAIETDAEYLSVGYTLTASEVLGATFESACAVLAPAHGWLA